MYLVLFLGGSGSRNLTQYLDANENNNIDRPNDKTSQSHHPERLITICDGLITSTGSKPDLTLGSYGCGEGFASTGSIPGGIVVKDNIPRGIFEIKDNTSTPAEATRQGIAEAFNLALMQLHIGVRYSDVMIPVIGSNGYLMEISCLILLEPSFPLVVRLSKVLDLLDNGDLKTAAGYFF